MKYLKRILFAIIPLLFYSSIVIAESNDSEGELKKCEYPENPGILNGRAASADQMRAVQKEVKAYLQRGDQYLDCIAKVEKSWGEEITPDHKRLVDALHNNVVDEMESIADLFNSALREFKGKSQGS